MIDFPIVDGHVHLWDVNKLRYPWLDDIPEINRTFLPEDYSIACGPIKVEKIVFMQCECLPSQYKEEVEWVTGLAKDEPRIKGIISWAPMEKGRAVLPELEKLKENKLVKGVRRIIQYEEDLEFCLKPDFIEAVNLLPELGLTFDVCISYKHNKNVVKFMERCTDVKMVLDHIGKPDIKNNMLEPWRSEIREMAKFGNLFCKVSSLATEADHKNWTAEGLRPYAETIFEFFGMDRLLYAGDWPVSSLAATLPVCVETIETLLKGTPKADLKKLFHDNAERFYGV
jgi:L-fuconolactonase